MAWLDSWAYHLTRDTWRDDLSTHISEAGFIQRVENVSPSQEEQTQTTKTQQIYCVPGNTAQKPCMSRFWNLKGESLLRFFPEELISFCYPTPLISPWQ